MIIMANTLAKSINECRHIKPNELITDTIKSLEKPIATTETGTYEIDILDDYNNIIYRHYCERTTKAAAETTGKNACAFYKSLDKCNYEYKVYKIK